MLARVVASQCGANFLSVTIPSILHSAVGDSEKALADVFRLAKTCRYGTALDCPGSWWQHCDVCRCCLVGGIRSGVCPDTCLTVCVASAVHCLVLRLVSMCIVIHRRPCVVFIDEFQALFRAREEGHEVRRNRRQLWRCAADHSDTVCDVCASRGARAITASRRNCCWNCRRLWTRATWTVCVQTS